MPMLFWLTVDHLNAFAIEADAVLVSPVATAHFAAAASTYPLTYRRWNAIDNKCFTRHRSKFQHAAGSQRQS